MRWQHEPLRADQVNNPLEAADSVESDEYDWLIRSNAVTSRSTV